MRQLRIGIDIDSTIYDLEAAWVAKYNKIYGDNMKQWEFDDWDFIFSKKKIRCTPESFFWISQHADVQWDTYPIHGAKEVLSQLQADGHLICIVSSAKRGVIPIKVAKLMQDFPELDYELHFTKEKWLVHLDVMIDDNPYLMKQWARLFNLPPLIVFSQRWNTKVPIPDDSQNLIVRAGNWHEVYRMINRQILGEEVEW